MDRWIQDMSYIYLLAGENLELAEAELEGFLKSQKIDEKPSRNGRLAETSSEPSQLKRLAMTHEVVKKLDSAESVDELDIEPPSGRFAVRSRTLSGEIEDLEKDLGAKLSTDSNKVDLEYPETVIRVYITEERIVVGRLVQDIDRGLYAKRANQERPFSSPVSLDPILARTLVNLSGLEVGEHVFDPFVGTGGILIEAGLCGIGVRGSDSSKEMVGGARDNLEEYGIINHEIDRKPVSDTSKEFREADAVITDLPYGKASLEQGDPVEEFLERLGSGTPAVFMYNEDSLGDHEPEFELYVHSNLTRYIYRENF